MAGKRKQGEIDFFSIEKKWQKKWEKARIFEVEEKKGKKKMFILEMYPYPSASFLHMGHVRNYTIGDVYARFKRMNGFNVLYPMGYDSFGLPAETAAKKEGIHPKKYAESAIKKIMEYQKALGLSYDWSRVLWSHDSNYYKWNQYFFLKLYEKGLAYRKKAPVNYCPNCESVLANEEAEGGKCWRCGKEVTKKEIEQWFFKITEYADRLLKDLKKINWPEKIKIMQENWIGKSCGIDIDFSVDGKKWAVFTTRHDTIFGVTFMVVSAQHPELFELVKKNKEEIKKFAEKCKKARSQEEIESLEKEGIFTGSFALNPLTKEKVPVYVGNFVVADYGSGMVMAVPCHDERDFQFAEKYKIPIKIVIQNENKSLKVENMEHAYVNEGILVNSGQFSGMSSLEAKEKISDYIEKNKLGRKKINYKIRDWLISRQRYWGTPIPIIYCGKCGIVPVPYQELPVLLPEKIDFKSRISPLLSNREFVEVKCPKCKGKAKRETDTMGGFVDSSWYFLRYCDSKNKKQAFDKKKVKYWMPVDQYIGGAEHAVMHLIYARFFVKALKDLGFLEIDEPFLNLFNQGIVYKDGKRMSKSQGNIITQDEISRRYGIDTARLFLMFVSSPDSNMEWSEEGIEGAFRIINKFFRVAEKIKNKKADEKIESKLNKTIKEVTENVFSFNYPKAIISASAFLDYLDLLEEVPKKPFEELLKLISLFCPHIAEELWHELGNKNFISLEKWPQADESKIDEKLEQEEKMIEKLIEDIKNIVKILENRKELKDKRKIKIFAIPKEVDLYKNSREKIEKKIGLEVEVLSVSEASRTGKIIKASPGKPGILVG